jgi:EmrB/QacA subfamily drug resistance transporter
MPHRWKVTAVVSAAAFMAALDLFIVNVAFPVLSKDFPGAGVSELSWVLNAYAIVFAALLVPAGRFADLIGRKRCFLIGLVVFVTASIACAAAPSVAVLIAGRALQAAGAAFLVPTSLGLLLAEFPPHERATAVGVWAAVGGIAAASGPVIGGLLVQASWRWIFLVNVPVGIVALVFGIRLLTEVKDTAGGRIPDLVGAAALMGGVASLTVAIVYLPDWGIFNVGTLAFVALGAGLLALVGYRSRHHPVPMVELSLLKVPSFTVSLVAVWLFYLAFAAMLLGSVLFLGGTWGYSALRTGLAIAPGPLTAAVFAFTSGRVTRRVGQRAVALIGTLAFAAGCAWFYVFAGVEPNYVVDFLPGMVLCGVGAGLVQPALFAAAATLPPERAATGSGLLSTARQLGSAFGVAALVALLGGKEAPDLAAFDRAWVFMVAASLAATAVCTTLKPPARTAAATVTEAATVTVEPPRSAVSTN